MNSPEPISDSTSSTSSPPPEEATYHPSSNTSYLANFTSHITSTLARTTGVGGSSSSSKRRLPGSSYASGPSDRDPKARKKTGDAGRSNSQYEGGPRDISSKKDKEELVDSGTVEWLRKGCIRSDTCSMSLTHLNSL
jgi:hypothetical protein